MRLVSAVLASLLLGALVAPAAAAQLHVDFSYSPTSPVAGDTVTFSGSCVHGAFLCGAPTYTWNVNGVVQTGQTVGVIFFGPGSVTATLNVHDAASGLSGAATRFFTVAPAPTPPPPGPPPPPVPTPPAPQSPPVAGIGGPAATLVGDRATYGSRSSDPDGDIATYAWSVAGGHLVTAGNAESVEVVFDRPGTAAVTLRVTDSGGRTSTAALIVDVQPVLPPFPPPSEPPRIGPEGLPLGPLPTVPPFVQPGQRPCPPDCGPFMPIQGFDPAAQPGAPPADLGLSPRQQKAMKALKKQLKDVANVADLAAKLGAFVTTSLLLAPEPVVSKGGAAVMGLGWGGVVMIASGIKAFADSQDPFDPDYRVVADPGRVTGPRAGTVPRRLRGVARAAHALGDSSVRFRGAVLAVLTAINRASSAAQAGDEVARRAQLRAVARYARSAAKLVARGPALRRRLAAALAAARQRVVVSPRRLRSTQRRIAGDGLPDEVVSVLRAFGAPDAWIQQYGSRLARLRMRRTLDAGRLLRNETLAAGERRTAFSLRRLAQFLSSGRGSRAARSSFRPIAEARAAVAPRRAAMQP